MAPCLLNRSAARMNLEVTEMKAVSAARHWSRGRLSRARRRRVRLNLLAWLRGCYGRHQSSPFGRHPLAA
jgi:hypothetical protein